MLVLHKNINGSIVNWENRRNAIRYSQGFAPSSAIPTLHLWALTEWKGIEKTEATLAIYANAELGNRLFTIGGYEANVSNRSGIDLLLAVEALLQKEAVEKIVGPMLGSTWQNSGYKTNGRNPLFYEEHFPLIYIDHWKKAGFEKAKDFFHYQLNPMPPINIEAQLLKANEKGIFLGRKENFDSLKLVEKMYAFLHRSFQKAFLFTPLKWESFKEKFLPLCSKSHPGIIWIGTLKEEIVTLAFGMKNPAKEHSYILKTLARDPLLPFKAMGKLTGLQFMKDCQERGGQEIIFANVREDNFSLFRAEEQGAKKIITNTLFQKQLL